MDSDAPVLSRFRRLEPCSWSLNAMTDSPVLMMMQMLMSSPTTLKSTKSTMSGSSATRKRGRGEFSS